MEMAMAKQATTMATQVILAAWDLAVDICASPCMVEFSRKLRMVKEAIFKTIYVVAESTENTRR